MLQQKEDMQLHRLLKIVQIWPAKHAISFDACVYHVLWPQYNYIGTKLVMQTN